MSDVMATITHGHTTTDVACTLGGGGAAARMDEWRRLREASGFEVEDIAGGLRLWLEAGATNAAADLARRESECCGFLDFQLASKGGRLHLDVTSPVPEAGVVIRALVGDDAGPGRERPECCPTCG